MNEDEISLLVESFYAKVREDPALGPVFNGAITDWPEHLEKLSAFWSSVMLTTGRYKGNPMAAHLKHLETIRTPMFERWLELWRETARETLGEHGADKVVFVTAAGAAPLAAAIKLRPQLAGKRIALIASGGNATPEQLVDVLGP